MKKKQQKNIAWLVGLLILTVGGGILFVGAASGWFDDGRAKLDAEYYDEGAELVKLSAGEYEELAEAGKSFVVFVDQNGCTTADRLRGYIKQYMAEKGILVYQMMFGEVKKATLHEQVKYYPSVAIVSRGRVVAYLKADSDEDADIYNDYEAFRGWMGKYLR